MFKLFIYVLLGKKVEMRYKTSLYFTSCTAVSVMGWCGRW